jgi:subtilase family serine protease
MDSVTMIRVVSGILAAVVLAIIVVRRRHKALE